MNLDHLSGRHFVVKLPGPVWRRRFSVQRAQAVDTQSWAVKGRATMVRYFYPEVSRHWTLAGAQKAAKRGNIAARVTP